MQDYLNVLKNNYANFSGRARRREYWMFFLFNIIVSVILMILDGVLLMTLGIAGLNLLYCLGIIVPGIAVAVRRLHDTGRSGWWLLIGLVPLVGLILLYFMCVDSDPGTNAFGENPKSGEANSTAGLAASV